MASAQNSNFCCNTPSSLRTGLEIIISNIPLKRMGEERGLYRVLLGNRREGDQWGDLGVDGWIILGWISKRWDVGMWTGLGWPRIETGGGSL